MTQLSHNTFVPGTHHSIRVAGALLQAAVPTIRQSVLNTAWKCSRKFFYEHCLGLSPKVKERSPSADTGTFWHLGMKTMYDSRNMEEAVGAMEGLYNTLARGMEKGLAEDLTGETAKAIKDLWSSLRKATVMLQVFWKSHPLHESIKVFSAERTYILPSDNIGTWTPGIPIVLQTKPDLELSDERTDTLWLVDHKSSGSDVADMMTGRSWAFQTLLYRYVAEHVHGRPVAGFIYNFMQTPGIIQCKTDEKNAKTWGIDVEPAYLRRVEEWYADKPSQTIRSAWIPSTAPAIWPQFILPVAVTLRNLLGTPEEPTDLTPADLDLFAPCDGSCATCREYNRTCPFLGLCDRDPVGWPTEITLFYDQSFPLVTLPTKEEPHAASDA